MGLVGSVGSSGSVGSVGSVGSSGCCGVCSSGSVEGVGSVVGGVGLVLVDGLAVFRLTRLVVEDEIASGFRDAWFGRFDPGSTRLGYLVTCPWCVGFWVSVGVVVVRGLVPGWWGPVGRVFALSGVAGLLSRVSGF